MPVRSYVIFNRKYSLPPNSSRIITTSYNVEWDPDTTTITSAVLNIYVTSSSFGAEVHLAMNGEEVYSWVAPWFPPYRDQRRVNVLDLLKNGVNIFILHLYNHRWFVGQDIYVYVELVLEYTTRPGSSRPAKPPVVKPSWTQEAASHAPQIALTFSGLVLGSVLGLYLWGHHIEKRSHR